MSQSIHLYSPESQEFIKESLMGPIFHTSTPLLQPPRLIPINTTYDKGNEEKADEKPKDDQESKTYSTQSKSLETVPTMQSNQTNVPKTQNSRKKKTTKASRKTATQSNKIKAPITQKFKKKKTKMSARKTEDNQSNSLIVLLENEVKELKETSQKKQKTIKKLRRALKTEKAHTSALQSLIHCYQDTEKKDATVDVSQKAEYQSEVITSKENLQPPKSSTKMNTLPKEKLSKEPVTSEPPESRTAGNLQSESAKITMKSTVISAKPNEESKHSMPFYEILSEEARKTYLSLSNSSAGTIITSILGKIQS